MRTVLMVLFDEVQSLDVTGPLEVFTGANTWLASRGDGPGYGIRTASLGGRAVRTSSGLCLLPGEDLRQVRAPGLDLLIVPGGAGSRRADAELTGWLRAHGPQARRLVSVCTGAFLLAGAGLLDGRRVTTHWAYCGALAAKYPQISVDPDPIFVRDGNVATSAGVTAGIDLALALVEDDLGRDAALDIARHLVVFLRRPGNQAQFSAQLAGQLANREPLRDVQRWIADHPAADLSVEALAAGRPPRDHALAGPGRARTARRHAGQRAGGVRGQVRDRGGRVRRHRHGPGPGRPHRRRRDRPGHPAHDRVRPAAALRRRLPGPRPGADRPHPAHPQPLPSHRPPWLTRPIATGASSSLHGHTMASRHSEVVRPALNPDHLDESLGTMKVIRVSGEKGQCVTRSSRSDHQVRGTFARLAT
jgi:transcriptional regulator GlxA family with amidase domain